MPEGPQPDSNNRVYLPSTGYVGVPVSIIADFNLTTETTPITYTWQATDQDTVTQTVPLSSTVDFTWDTPGTKAITVTATNGYSEPVTTMRTINIIAPGPYLEPQAVAAATISGAGEGKVGATYPFTVTVSPTTAATPITYTWQATDQDTVSHTDALISMADFIWDTPGTKAMTVTANNGYGEPVTTTHSISIQEDPDGRRVYLPLVTR